MLAASRRHGAALLSIAIASLAISPESDALEVKRSENVLNVLAGETVDGSVLGFAMQGRV